MTMRNILTIAGLYTLAMTIIPPMKAQNIGFGFGVGGRGGGVSFGVGTGSHGYYGGGYRPWGYRGGYDDYYYPRTTYVVQEPPVQPIQVEYVTQRQEPTGKLDLQGKGFWLINNSTDQDLKITSDTSALKLPAQKEPRKLYRTNNFNITVTAADGNVMTFNNVRDHHISIIRDAEDEKIEIETWNE